MCLRYATFCHLAGVSPHDDKAAAAVPPLPPVDSLNLWGLLSGESFLSRVVALRSVAIPIATR